MASAWKSFVKIYFLVILSNLQECRALQCYHCSYFEQTRLQDNYKLFANNKRQRLPSDHHSTCAQGHTPSDAFIVDCSTNYFNVLTKTFRDHPDPQNPFENIEKKVERHIQATKNSTMGCATVFVNGEWTVSGINFTVENVYRSCFPNTTSFSHLLSEFQSKFPEMEISGYNCDHEANCNGMDYNTKKPDPLVSYANSKHQNDNSYYLSVFVSFILLQILVIYNVVCWNIE